MTAVISAGISLRVLRGSDHLPSSLVEAYRSMMALPDTILHLLPLMRGSYKYSTYADANVQAKWKTQFPAPSDSGFLLLPQFDPKAGNVTVKLMRLSDGATALQWYPKRQSIPERAGSLSNLVLGDRLDILHPLLVTGGDIVAHAAEGLLRVSPCKSSPNWFLDRSSHHSIELSAEGNFITSGLNWTDHVAVVALQTAFEDNTLLTVTADGKVLSEKSFAEILRDNGLLSLIYSRAGMQMNADPLHLNQITPAIDSTDYWRKGDLLISSRHLSGLFIYRPGENKIVWRMEGNWLNQHSAQFQSDHEIALLDNNFTSLGPKDGNLSIHGINKIKVFDFRTGEVSEPYAGMINPEQPFTPTQGRIRILPDGLFFEETDSGRLLRWQNGRLIWSYFKKAPNDQIIGGGWSRYYTRDEVSRLLPGFDLEAKTFAECASK